MSDKLYVFNELKSAVPGGFVTDINQVRGAEELLNTPQIIYVPNEASMPETPEEDVLYLIGEETVVMIKFYVNDKTTEKSFEFQAEEGMTWSEFIDSDYNPNYSSTAVVKAFTLSKGYVKYNTSLSLREEINGTLVMGTDKIISGKSYYAHT